MDHRKKTELIETWYRQYAAFLFQYARQFVDSHAAQEIVQETFRIVCEMEDLVQIKHPKTWLRKVAGNVTKNWVRQREKWNAMLVDMDRLSDGGFVKTEDERDIEVEYAGLVRESDLRLLKLLASGYLYSDVAEQLGISAEACRKRAKRAAERLREKLTKDHEKIF